MILTTNKNSISSVLNNNLPLILINKQTILSEAKANYKLINEIITKSDEYVLIIKDDISKSKRIEIGIYSERNQKELNKLISEFST